MENHVDFWVVVGTAGPVFALALIVAAGDVISSAQPKLLGELRTAFVAYTAGGLGFLVSIIMLLLAMTALGSPGYDSGIDRTIAFALIATTAVCLEITALMSAQLKRQVEQRALSRAKSARAFKRRRRP